MPFLAGRKVTVAGTLTAIRPEDGHEGEVHAVLYLESGEKKPRSHEDVLALLKKDLPDVAKESEGRPARERVLDILSKMKKAKGKDAADWKARRLTPPEER